MGNQTVNVKIEVEARTTAANANLEKMGKTADSAKQSTAGLNKELANYDKAVAKAQKGTAAQRQSLGDAVKGFSAYDKAAAGASARNDKLGKSFASAAKSTWSSDPGSFGSATVRAKTGLQQLGGVIDARITQLGPMGLAGVAVAAAISIERMSARSLQLRDVQGALTISIDKARVASNGLIDDFTLQTQAITAVRFGIAKTDADYAKLVKTATLLARTTGQDSTKAVEDLTTALSRQSPMILDNLGLQVNVEKANRDYARSLGKTADKLTDAEKKQAFFNAAMADADKKTAHLTVTTDSWAVSVQQIKVDLLNALDTVIQLPENIAAFRKELEATGIAGEAFSTAMELAGRIGLGVFTLGLSEAIPLVIKLKDAFADLREFTPMRGATAGTLGIGDAAKQAVLDFAKGEITTAGNTLALQGGLMASLHAGNETLEKELKKLKKNKAHARELAGPKGFDAFAHPEAMKADIARIGRMQKRASGAEAFGALDEEFENSRKEFEQQRERAEEQLLENRKRRIEEEREFRKKAHEDEIERQNELIARQEAAGQVAGDTVAGLAQAWLAAGDLSAKGFKRVLAEWGKAESLRLAGVAISEGIQALVSLAFFNFPQAALHGAAAAAAGAGAAAIAALTGAVGGFGNTTKSVKSGFGGGGFGGGSSAPAANDGGSVPSMMSKDQTPTSTQHAQSGGGGKGSGGGVTNHFGPNSIVVLGTIDDTSALKIDQAIKRTKRKIGATGT